MRRISASASRPVCSTTSSASRSFSCSASSSRRTADGLHGHHADAVADDVVQLARDPRPFLLDGEPRLLLALELRLLGEPLRLVGLARAVPPSAKPMIQATENVISDQM